MTTPQPPHLPRQPDPAAVTVVPAVEPDVGIPDLVRRLTDDAKRLVGDEVRLAKLEARESMHLAARGSLWLAIAFGVGVVAMVAATVLLIAVVGRIFDFNYWAGALIVGALELVVALLLVKGGIKALKQPPYTLPETRAELRQTVDWAKEERTEGEQRIRDNVQLQVRAD